MSSRRIERIAIVGGGPSGAFLANELHRDGRRVVVLDRGRRAPLVVGESLVPAVVPYLRRLGIEEQVAGFSVLKPGATFVLDTENRVNLTFADTRGGITGYSYNTPRDQFDQAVTQAVAGRGVPIVATSAALERADGDDRVALDRETQEIVRETLGGDPDLVVDASGRRRLVANLLDLPVVEGPRRDAALHAHLSGVRVEDEGNVHTDRLTHGWSWRIPLRGKVSVGLVVNGEHLRKFGDTAETQFDAYLASDPVIRDWAAPGTRCSPVVRYTNYQLRTTRGFGPGWALVGDAFGFVDPVFSSGMLLSFESAELLAQAIADGRPEAFERYQAEMLRRYTIWQRVVDYFYDGRLLTLIRVGEYVRHTPIGRLMDFHFSKHLPRIFTGEGATSRYSNGLLRFMCEYGLARNDPSLFEVH